MRPPHLDTQEIKLDWSAKLTQQQTTSVFPSSIICLVSVLVPSNLFSVLIITGRYMYIEASSPRHNGDKARLVSKTYPATNNQCLSFRYHMYGISIGTLKVIFCFNNYRSLYVY